MKKATVTGFGELQLDLDRFQAGILSRATRNVFMRAGTPILQEARVQAPKRTGNLRKALRKRAWQNKPKATAGVIVSFSQTYKKKNPATGRDGGPPDPNYYIPRNYAHLAVFGAQSHSLGGGSTVGRTFTRRVGGKMQTSKVKHKQHGRNHPGAKGNDFLTRAIKQSGTEARLIVVNGLQDCINKQIAGMKEKGKIR